MSDEPGEVPVQKIVHRGAIAALAVAAVFPPVLVVLLIVAAAGGWAPTER